MELLLITSISSTGYLPQVIKSVWLPFVVLASAQLLLTFGFRQLILICFGHRNLVLQTSWLIKVLVLHRGPIRDYKTSNGEGVIRLVIFVDEEGTKIQGTLFNEQIQTWEDYFEPLQAYYIEDGKILTPKANYLSVNTEVEISFRQHTKVAKCDNDFMTENFANCFIFFVEAARLPMGALFSNMHPLFSHVIGILLEVKSLLGEGRRTWREVIITDDRYDRKILTLWGDLAEIEGAKLASFQHDHPVVAFCDIKASFYQGEFGLSTTPVSSVLLDPKMEIAEELQKWFLGNICLSSSKRENSLS